MKLNKGFTLIELLVVIAIIGILSSVVLASLGTARAKAKEAAFKTEASQLVASAVIQCDGDDGTHVITVAGNESSGLAVAATNNTCADFQGAGGVAVTGDNSCAGTIKEEGFSYTASSCE